MNCLILSEANLAPLAALNESAPNSQRLTPFTLADGRRALNADLLADCGAGATWSHFASFLASFVTEAITPEELAPPTLSPW